MGFHRNNLKVLKNVDVVSISSASSTSTAASSSHEPVEVVYPTKKPNKKEKKKKKKKMSGFLDLFHSSFTSAAPHSSSSKKQRSHKQANTVYTEIQLLKVTASRNDLDRFQNEFFELKRNVGTDVDVKFVLPSEKHQENVKKLEEEQKEGNDFLDYMFSDTIPFLHDFLTYGSPEAEFYQIKGKEFEVDLFNKLCAQMVFANNLQCKLEVTDRKKIPIQNKLKSTVLGGPNSQPDVLDQIFVDDFSTCSPFLHNLLVSVF